MTLGGILIHSFLGWESLSDLTLFFDIPFQSLVNLILNQPYGMKPCHCVRYSKQEHEVQSGMLEVFAAPPAPYPKVRPVR